MKKGRNDHEKGRSLVWVLAQMRGIVEAQEIEKLTTRLEELQQLAERKHSNGHGREPQRLIEAATLPS